jgi:putative ABC transport system substrate-binding protein
MMQRRAFITLLGGAAAAWPLAARAQQPGKLPTIGFLGTSTPAAWTQFVAAFVQRVNAVGWIEGRTVAIEYRWAEGREERYAQIAKEFVQLPVDIIVTSGMAVPAAKQATSVIPVGFTVATDPVGTGLVSALARPGGNVTGLSLQSAELAGKRVELLREVLPDLHRLAILANSGSLSAPSEIAEVQSAARIFGVEAVPFEVQHAGDIVSAFAALKDGAQALYVCGSDPLIAPTCSDGAISDGSGVTKPRMISAPIGPTGLCSAGGQISRSFSSTRVRP